MIDRDDDAQEQMSMQAEEMNRNDIGNSHSCSSCCMEMKTPEKTGTMKRPMTQNRLNPKTSRIAIIGSGLGGLSAAISLERVGFTNIVLLERDASVDSRREGYGLTLSYHPQGPLAHMGVLELVAQQDCPSRSHYTFGTDGTIFSYYGNSFRTANHKSGSSGRGQRGNLRCPRSVLRQILMDQVNAPILFNKQFTGFQIMDDDPDGKLLLTFQDGSQISGVDLLIGADGIRSAVVKHLVPNDSGLNYLGIFIILGISDFYHALLDERGFYTVDGNHRLFTMPYEGSRLSGNKRRIMWQLSYQLESETEAQRLSAAGPHVLQEEVLSRCKDWHDPVISMVRSTPHHTIWGTNGAHAYLSGLMDREPKELIRSLENNAACCRVVVLGDAVHSMSPFKGAGANQALLDGPLLATWLQRASLASAINGFFREMANRTQARVLASREAAAYLHSPAVLLTENFQTFAGVSKDRVPELLRTLQNQRIGASLGASLDARVNEIMETLNCKESNHDIFPVTALTLAAQKEALVFASEGNTQGLRILSLNEEAAVLHARDPRGRTCLHLSAQSGHYYTCKWLLTEAFIGPNIEDADGVTALELAGDNQDIVHLIQTVLALQITR